MRGGHRTVVSGREGVEQCGRLKRRAHFADEDAVGAHAERVRHQISDTDGGLAAGHDLEVNDVWMR